MLPPSDDWLREQGFDPVFIHFHWVASPPSQEPAVNDRLIVLLVICFLGVTILLCAGGGFYLAGKGVDVPEFLVGLGGTALGALGSLLARTHTDGPQDVRVVDQPVEVDPT